MDRARKHRRTAVLFGILAAMALPLMGSGVAAAAGPAAPTAAEEQEAATWCAVRTLRADVRLGDDVLAAMGCSQAQAEAVLAALVAWHSANAADLAAKQEAVHAATEALAKVQQKIHVGPRNEALLASVPQLESSLASARASLARTFDAAAASATVGLSGEQTSSSGQTVLVS